MDFLEHYRFELSLDIGEYEAYDRIKAHIEEGGDFENSDEIIESIFEYWKEQKYGKPS